MNARKKAKRGPAYQMYADRWNNSGTILRMTWEEQGMFLWLLNRAWIDGGIPRDAKVVSRMMPGGPKVSVVTKILREFSVEIDAETVTHPQHAEQAESHARLSSINSACARKRWADRPRDGAEGDANAYPSASNPHDETGGESDANGMLSQPPNLPKGKDVDEISPPQPKGEVPEGGASERAEPRNDFERRVLASKPVSDWAEPMRRVWLRWLRHLTETRRFAPSMETLGKHCETLRELPSDVVRIRWLETAIDRGLWSPAEPFAKGLKGAKKTEVHSGKELTDEERKRSWGK